MVNYHHFGVEDIIIFVRQYRLFQFGQNDSVCYLFVCRYICSSRVGIVAILCLHLPRFQSRGSVGGQLPTMGPAPEVTFTHFYLNTRQNRKKMIQLRTQRAHREPNFILQYFKGSLDSESLVAKQILHPAPHTWYLSFFYTIAIWGQEILYLKVCKFRKKVVSR